MSIQSGLELGSLSAVKTRASFIRNNCVMMELDGLEDSLQEEKDMMKDACSSIDTANQFRGLSNDVKKEYRQSSSQEEEKAEVDKILEEIEEQAFSDEAPKKKRKKKETREKVKKSKINALEDKGVAYNHIDMPGNGIKKSFWNKNQKERQSIKSGNTKPIQSNYVEHLKNVIKTCGLRIPPSIYKKVKQVREKHQEAILIKELEAILDREGLSSNLFDKDDVDEEDYSSPSSSEEDSTSEEEPKTLIKNLRLKKEHESLQKEEVQLACDGLVQENGQEEDKGTLLNPTSVGIMPGTYKSLDWELKKRQSDLRVIRRQIRRKERDIEGKVTIETTIDGQPIGPHKERFVQCFRQLVKTKMDISLERVSLCSEAEHDAVRKGLEALFEWTHVDRYMKKKTGKIFRTVKKEVLDKISQAKEANKEPIKPSWLSDDKWERLKIYHGSDYYKKMKARNKANRAKQCNVTNVGRIGYLGLKNEMEKTLNRVPTREELFIQAHTSKGYGKNPKGQLTQFACEQIQKTNNKEAVTNCSDTISFGKTSRGLLPGAGIGASPPSSIFIKREYLQEVFMELNQQERAEMEKEKAEIKKLKMELQEQLQLLKQITSQNIAQDNLISASGKCSITGNSQLALLKCKYKDNNAIIRLLDMESYGIINGVHDTHELHKELLYELLEDGKWASDDIVHLCMELCLKHCSFNVQEKVCVATPFFFERAKGNVFNGDYMDKFFSKNIKWENVTHIFLPIPHNSHWTLVVFSNVNDISRIQVMHLDSLHKEDQQDITITRAVRDAIRKSRHPHAAKLATVEWIVPKVPQQPDLYSCGWYMTKSYFMILQSIQNEIEDLEQIDDKWYTHESVMTFKTILARWIYLSIENASTMKGKCNVSTVSSSSTIKVSNASIMMKVEGDVGTTPQVEKRSRLQREGN